MIARTNPEVQEDFKKLNPIERSLADHSPQGNTNMYFPSTEDLRMALESQFTIWRLHN